MGYLLIMTNSNTASETTTPATFSREYHMAHAAADRARQIQNANDAIDESARTGKTVHVRYGELATPGSEILESRATEVVYGIGVAEFRGTRTPERGYYPTWTVRRES